MTLISGLVLRWGGFRRRIRDGGEPSFSEMVKHRLSVSASSSKDDRGTLRLPFLSAFRQCKAMCVGCLRHLAVVSSLNNAFKAPPPSAASLTQLISYIIVLFIN